MNKLSRFSRRQFLAGAGTLAAGLMFPRQAFSSLNPILKTIPSTGEQLPVIGMGTSRTYDARSDTALKARLQQVTQTFFDMGGGMIDSSPMYRSSEKVIGELLPNIKTGKQLFSATKVWTDGRMEGVEQMEHSRQLWGVERFDLMQIHNLRDWQIHLKTLQQMKAEGKIRYIGITTSHGRFHDELQTILKKHEFDFLQLSYNIADREVESNLLPIAQDKGIAVIVNRPFQRGELFRQTRGKELPPWVQEFDCDSWGQYFLKFAVSHPAVTCTIPATSKKKHMLDNMQAGRGKLPSAEQRREMIRYVELI